MKACTINSLRCHNHERARQAHDSCNGSDGRGIACNIWCANACHCHIPWPTHIFSTGHHSAFAPAHTVWFWQVGRQNPSSKAFSTMALRARMSFSQAAALIRKSENCSLKPMLRPPQCCQCPLRPVCNPPTSAEARLCCAFGIKGPEQGHPTINAPSMKAHLRVDSWWKLVIGCWMMDFIGHELWLWWAMNLFCTECLFYSMVVCVDLMHWVSTRKNTWQSCVNHVNWSHDHCRYQWKKAGLVNGSFNLGMNEWWFQTMTLNEQEYQLMTVNGADLFGCNESHFIRRKKNRNLV